MQGIYPVSPWGNSEAEGFFAWAEARSRALGRLDRHVSGAVRAFARRDPHAQLPAKSGGGPNGFRSRFPRLRPDAAPAGVRLRNPRDQPRTCRGGLAPEDPVPSRSAGRPFDSTGLPGPEQGRSTPRDLSVERWASGLVAMPVAKPRNPTLRVPSVLSQAYTLNDGRLGILLVNLRADSEELVRLTVDPAAYGLAAGTYEIRQDSAGANRTPRRLLRPAGGGAESRPERRRARDRDSHGRMTRILRGPFDHRVDSNSRPAREISPMARHRVLAGLAHRSSDTGPATTALNREDGSLLGRNSDCSDESHPV